MIVFGYRPLHWYLYSAVREEILKVLFKCTHFLSVIVQTRCHPIRIQDVMTHKSKRRKLSKGMERKDMSMTGQV